MSNGKMFQKNFIAIGDTNIKISNIKAFGISSTSVTTYYRCYQKLYLVRSGYKKYYLMPAEGYYDGKQRINKERYDDIKSGLAEQKYIGAYIVIEYPNANERVETHTIKESKNFFAKPSDVEMIEVDVDNVLDPWDYDYASVTPSKKYLYVTTYQNDNYQFFEDNGQFNIYTKLNELKALLG